MSDAIRKASDDMEAVSRSVFVIEAAANEKALSEATPAALFDLANHTADLTAVLMRITRKVDEETAKRIRAIDYPGLIKEPVKAGV